MATGNQVLPGAPVTGEHAEAGRPEAAEHARRLGQPFAAGQVGAEQAPPRTRRLWPGAGGRWLVWAARIALWAVVLLIGYRGVVAIVTGYPGLGGAAAPEAGPGNVVGGFPAALGKAYALEFGQVYLNFNPAATLQRARSLSAFLPPGTDPELGWTGAASRTLQSEQVAGIHVVSSHRAVITLLARVNGNLVELGVPIYASHGALAVSGYPALLPAPGQVVPPALASVRQDRAAGLSLSRSLPGFFRAFASGDAIQLGKFTAGHGSITGLGGAVRFGGITRLSVPAGPGMTRQITVTVRWRFGSVQPAAGQVGQTQPASSQAQLTMSYGMTVVRHRASWLVRSIGAAGTQHWPSP
jgi:Conjugative transposon protein TcpC